MIKVEQIKKDSQNGVANVPWENRYRGATGDDALQVVPSASNSSGMFFNEVFQRDAHFLFYCDRVVNMSRDAVQLGSRVLGSTKASKPIATTSDDSRC